MDKQVSLTELYRKYCEQYGSNVIADFNCRVNLADRVLKVSFDSGLSDEEILKGIGSVEISLDTVLPDGWELLAGINNKTYRSEKVELLHHNTLGIVLEPLGFSCVPKEWGLSAIDFLFRGSVADLEKLAQTGWIPAKLHDYTLPPPIPTGNPSFPLHQNRLPPSHHINDPLQPYRIQIVTREPNSLVLYKPELTCDAYTLKHKHHAPYEFLLQEHLPRLDEVFTRK